MFTTQLDACWHADSCLSALDRSYSSRGMSIKRSHHIITLAFLACVGHISPFNLISEKCTGISALAVQVNKIYNQGCLISKPNIKLHNYWLHVKDLQAVHHAWKHSINGGFRKGNGQIIISPQPLYVFLFLLSKHVTRHLHFIKSKDASKAVNSHYHFQNLYTIAFFYYNLEKFHFLVQQCDQQQICLFSKFPEGMKEGPKMMY